MPLKSYTTIAPGGWRYTQPDTNWKHASMGPIQAAVKEILEHRRFNNLPRATNDEVLADLEAFTCQRLGNDVAWCNSGDPAQKKTTTEGQAPQSVASPVLGSSLRTVANGALILKDWLGSGGKPVSDDLAQARANVCLNDCSDPTRFAHYQNKTASFFGKVTGEVAKAILEQRREKLNLGLKVSGEDKLFTCAVCKCHLPLKVWVPMDVIMGRTEPETLKNFPDWCWMKTENRRTNRAIETTETQPQEEP